MICDRLRKIVGQGFGVKEQSARVQVGSVGTEILHKRGGLDFLVEI